VINKPLILAAVILFIALIAVGVWYHNNAEEGSTAEETSTDGLNQERAPVETERSIHVLFFVLPLAVMFGLILWRSRKR
jgi:hypothetical protein